MKKRRALYIVAGLMGLLLLCVCAVLALGSPAGRRAAVTVAAERAAAATATATSAPSATPTSSPTATPAVVANAPRPTATARPTPSPTAAAAPLRGVRTGGNGVVTFDGAKKADKIAIARDEASFGDVSHALAIEDYLGLLELMARNKAFAVPAGTKVKVLENGFFKTKVRVLEGDMTGAAGWVPAEWVRAR